MDVILILKNKRKTNKTIIFIFLLNRNKMKDILINYPIKILQQELINIRTSYRLEKKRIIEILKDMKSIKKLTKEELIELLIKYNYDISKLPKLEDLIKPKKQPKPRAKKEPKPKEKEINNIFKDIPKLDDVFKDIDKKDKYIYIYDKKSYKYTDKDKQVLKDIIKKMYEIIDKYDVIKKDLLFIKDEIINLAKLNNEEIDDKYINYNEFIDKYLLSKLYDALDKLKLDRFEIFSGSDSFNDIIRKTIDSYYTSRTLIYNKFDFVVYSNLIDDKFDIEDEKKYLNNIIERKKELLKRKEELLKLKLEKERKEEQLKNSTYIPSNYLFNKEYYFDDNIWEKNYTMKDLIENWDTDIIPIIFLKVEPKKYDIFETMVKKVNGIISKKGLKKDTSILIPELLVFTKDINNKILEYYIKEAGTKKYKYKYAIDKLYRGLFRIIERIYIENDIPRNNITNVFGDDQETLYLRGVKQGLPVRTLQAASKELLLWDDKIGTFIRNPETLL